MAGEDRVDALDAGEQERGVLQHFALALPSMPEWDSAMTISAPSSFICGTQACAASTMSRVIDLAGEVAANPRS